MRAEIATIGDELCRGEIVNTNASRLAENLWDLDITVDWMTSCRDEPADMRSAIATAVGRSDVVVVSGGLGPTDDDRTVDVICDLVGVGPEAHPPSLERMEKRFRSAGMALVENTRRQVRVPAGARVYDNRAGLAPGFEVAIDGTAVICLPGPPRELERIFADHIEQRLVQLREARGGGPERIARRIYRVFGSGESRIAAALEGLEIPDGATVHYQVKFPETLVKAVVRDSEGDRAHRLLEKLETAIRARLGDRLYGTDDDSLAAALGRSLAARGQTVACAESCTGGLLGGALTAVAGSSETFLGGIISYTNELKQSLLGVSSDTLATHGAVSEACVHEMAQGARTRTGADWGVSVSGIAGPGGGTEDKPVGTVWIAVAGPDQRAHSKRFHWPGSRDQVRTLATYWAMATLRRMLLEESHSEQ